MTVRERFHSGTPTLSYELFPPRSAEAEETLWMTYERLATTDPDFFSVTYGAAGSTRDRSLGVVETLLESSPVPVVAHVTLVGASRAELANVIEKYLDKGARDFLALRGDPPEGQETWSPHPEGLQYASELVSLIRDVARGYGADDVSVGVTAFPTQHADSRQRMGALDVLRAKQEAGADFAITQVFHEHDQLSLIHI